MRRLAAVLALVAVSQSVVLRSGVLCDAFEALHARVASTSSMPGMDMTGAPTTERSGQRGTDRHHGDAHCPLMATCTAAAVTSPAIDVGRIAFAARSVIPVRSGASHVERIAPEPPPPKS